MYVLRGFFKYTDMQNRDPGAVESGPANVFANHPPAVGLDWARQAPSQVHLESSCKLEILNWRWCESQFLLQIMLPC